MKIEINGIFDSISCSVLMHCQHCTLISIAANAICRIYSRVSGILVVLFLDISFTFRIYRFSIDLLRCGTYFYYSLDAFSPSLKRAMYHSLLPHMLNLRLFWWIELMETEQVRRLLYSNGGAEEKFCKNQNHLIF